MRMLPHENHGDIFYVKNLLTTLRQTFYLTSIQINFMKRDKNSQIFCIANKFKSLPLARFATS